MTLKLFERRYWNVSVGKVYSMFSENENSRILNSIPDSQNFMIWIDSKPFPLEFDLVLATSAAVEQRNTEESKKAAIGSDNEQP